MSIQSTLLAILLLSTVKLYSQKLSDAETMSINNILSQYVTDDSPGLALGIVKNGKIVYEKYLGYANLEHKVKIDKNTRFNIASTAKQFTALMILQLSLEEKLDLEDDIRNYIPSLYPNVKEEIKIRHLINHTSGIRDYVFILEMQNKAYWSQVGMDNQDVIELLKKQRELIFKPGSRYLYSNSGYTILTKIIEKASGESFNDYSKKFFEELGMNETSFIRGYMRIIPNRANPYSDWGDGNWLRDLMATKFNGDGFLYTTLNDQLVYELMVQKASQNKDTLLAKSQQSIPNSEIKTYGFGLELDGRLGRVAQYHSGSTFGYHSHITRYSEENLSIFVMSNKGNIWSGDIADEVSTVLLSELDTQQEYDRRLSESLDGTQQLQILGQYISSKGNLIRIIKEEGKIFWKYANDNPYEIIPESTNMFSVDYNEEIKIRFFQNELVRFYPTGRTIAYKKQPYIPASASDIEGFVGIYESNELDMSFTIRLTENNMLKILFSNREKERDVEVLNKNELLASNFRMKVQRDQFERVTEVLVTLNDRAKNNRFRKKTNLMFKPKIEIENGFIQVTTIESSRGDASNILLTANNRNGNEIWSKQYGGDSYDKASSILSVEDGYLIIGSTSSYGNGNYDILLIKTDKKGKKLWQSTFGDFYNEYGYTAEVTEKGYLIKGTKQYCTSNSDVFNRKCITNVWFISIDKNGKEISSRLLEDL